MRPDVGVSISEPVPVDTEVLDGRACRLCGAPLPTAALITLEPVPRAAQAFLKPDDLSTDYPIALRVRSCEACGLIQAQCPPVANWQHVIRSGRYSPEMRAVRERQLRHFLGLLPRGSARVLEAGCGSGDLLEILRDCGAAPVGLEASASAVDIARRKGLSVERGYPTAGQAIPRAPFDAFVSVNVLEHALDPRDFLMGVRDNLADGAIGLVEVPSFERMVERRRFYDFIADHLSYFTEDTLSLALELSGFDVIDVSREWWPDDLVALVRVRHAAPVGDAQQALDHVVEAVRAFIDRFAVGGQSVAIWGASHQALTLLALAGAENLGFVVDSAVFKQGLRTPVTHLPVVAPAHLMESSPAAILVMAAGYSDEVVRTLRQELGYQGAIGVLRGDDVELLNRGGRGLDDR